MNIIYSSTENRQRNKEPWLAVSLSWLVPGMGQFYAGSFTRGMIFIVLVALMNVLLVTSLLSIRCSILVSLAVGIVNFIILPAAVSLDAFKLVKKKNTPNFEADRTSTKDRWLAVFLSLLLPGLGHGYARQWILSGFYFLVFCVLKVLSNCISYATLGLLLFRVLVCVHAYISIKVDRKLNKDVIIVFAVFLAFVGCLNSILLPRLIGAYLGGTVSAKWGPSMEPTIKTCDKLIINKIIYAQHDPKVGDIIVFKVPKYVKIPKNTPKETTYMFCKRIVAVGGEIVRVRDGRLYVNSKERIFKISEDSNRNLNNDAQISNGRKPPSPYYICGVVEPYHVQEGCYFLLGDNRENSLDSRYFGAIPKEEIIGKVIKIYWPPNRIGTVY